MRTRKQFPHKVEMIEHAQVKLADGVHLSARIWLPQGAAQQPVPAILEYLPYRKRDGTSARDALNHPWFAGHGYASVRVDMRGCGDSEGVLLGEYLQQEQDDCLEVLAWIAAQPWCSGSIGMIGISWGGFNGLQVAARRPKELKAVVSICSTDDRYADDIHFMGGALLVDKLLWGSTMFAINATPPDPALVGEHWRDLWMGRLEGSGFWLEEWHRRQRRDAFWKHGSVCEDYAAIEAPVLLVGGWADGYTNPIFRMLDKLSCPRRALVGPWAHKYPNFALPGPRIGFLQECKRWWDQWLKSEQTGVMDEPMLRAWVQDSTPPAPEYAHRPGRWVAEAQWPSPRIQATAYPLSAAGIEKPGRKVRERALAIRSPQTTGAAAGQWCPYGLVPDQAGDQRSEAGGSLVFDSAPLTSALEFLGAPMLDLDLSADRPQALLAATLCEVLPDGAVSRLSYGILNLSHRDSHEHPTPLLPGERYRVRLQLNDCGQRIARGGRLRLALSTCYWPTVWPSPEPVTLTVHTGASTLTLPLRPRNAADSAIRFEPAECAPPIAAEVLRAGGHSASISQDLASGEWRMHRVSDDGLTRLTDIGWEYGARTEQDYAIHPDDPLSARVGVAWTKHYGRGDWRVRIEARTRMRASGSHFHLAATLDAFEGETRVFSREWDCKVPRDHN